MADEGRKLVDKELRKLERELAKEYAKAQKEMQDKLDRRLKTFEALDGKKKKFLEQGKISQKEYDKWKKGQLLQSGWMKSMIDKYSSEQMKLNKKSADKINDRLQKVYADSYNFGTYQVEKNTGISTSFTLFNKNTVKRLLNDDPNLLPEVEIDESKDKRWNKQMMRSALTQGVLQGDGAKGIAKRLSDVTNMDKVSAIRNARTMTTGAENAGKLDSYYRAREMGIPVKKMWQSTIDERTRTSHRHLDGEVRELEEAFSNGLQYPGDVDSGVSGTEIYNCRCNLSMQISGFERDMTDLSRNNKLGDMSYDEWKAYTKSNGGIISNEKLLDKVKKLKVSFGEVDNLIPLADKKIIQESARRYNQAKEVSDKLKDYTVETISLSKLETRQEWLDYEKLEDMANYEKLGELLTVDAMEKIRAIKYKGHIILVDGNHRVNLMKLKGYKKVRLLIRNV